MSAGRVLVWFWPVWTVALAVATLSSALRDPGMETLLLGLSGIFALGMTLFAWDTWGWPR